MRRTVWLTILLAVSALGIGLAAWHRSRENGRRQQIAAALAARDPAHARDLLLAQAKADATDAETAFLLARAERRLNDFPAAGRYLARARELGYGDQQVAGEELLLLAQSGHLDRAEPHLARLLEEAGGDLPEICEAYVVGYFRHLKFDAAQRLLDRWEQESPEDPQPHLLRASMWAHLERWSQAEQAAREALQRAPEHETARFGLAGALYRQNRYHEAAAEYKWCLEADPQRHEARSGLADCLFNLGENDQARAMFAEVLANDPEHFGARLGLGQLALSDGRPDEALNWLTPAARARPFDLGARYHLALALKATGRAEEAEQHFEFVKVAQAQLDRYAVLSDVVAREPGNLAARHELGVIVLRYFDPAKGLGWLESVLERDPQHQATHRVLAEYFERRAERERAAYHRRMGAPAETESNSSPVF